VDEAAAYFMAQGWSPDDAAIFFDHFEATATAKGWRQGNGKPITDWQASARNWIRRSVGAPRGVAAGLGGGGSGKNRLKGRGAVASGQSQDVCTSPPILGLDEALAESESAASEGGGR
jgi:hypothetical protein